MRTFRKERIASLIQEELGEEFIRNLEFPEGALVTITGVEISDNLEHAKVWLSVLPARHSFSEGGPARHSFARPTKPWRSRGEGGPEELAEKALRVAEKAQRDLQYRLLKKINIKPMPRIGFALDRGLERAAEVEKKLLEEKGG